MTKKILIILAHPNKDSFCNELKKSYIKGAEKSKAEIKSINLSDLKFDPILHKGYKEIQKLEPDLIKAQEQIKWADHLVFIYPTWWGSVPALLKGFLDRIILPGFAFKFHSAMKWDKLLKGKSARLIVTMDSPPWLYYLFFKSPGHNMMKNATLKFCGVSPVRIINVGPLKMLKEKKIKSFLEKVKHLGEKQI